MSIEFLEILISALLVLLAALISIILATLIALDLIEQQWGIAFYDWRRQMLKLIMLYTSLRALTSASMFLSRMLGGP